jgi:hypothetical protein
MRRNEIHSIINILGLMIGITACLVIFLLARLELSYDTFHSNKDRIYRVVAEVSIEKRPGKMAGLLVPLPLALQQELTGVRHVAAFYNYEARINIPQSGEKEPGGAPGKLFDMPDRGTPSPIIITDSQYFGIFHYQWLAGTARTSLTKPGSVVLTVNEMKKYFGDISPDEALGRTVIYADSLYTTVAGVVNDLAGNTDFNFKDFISLSTVPGTFLRNTLSMGSWGGWARNVQAFVELSPGSIPTGGAPVPRHPGKPLGA